MSEAEVKRKDSEDSKEEQNKPRLVAKFKRNSTSSIEHEELSSHTVSVGVCLPANLKDYVVKEKNGTEKKKEEIFAENIILPILEAGVEKIYLFVGSIAHDRPIEKLLEEIERDKECESMFREAILAVMRRHGIPEERVEILSWAHLAGKPSYRDLHKYIRQECSHGDVQKALLEEDIPAYLLRQRGPDGQALLYPEGSDEYEFIHWYATKWFRHENAPVPGAEDDLFTSVRSVDGNPITIPRKDVISQILQWQHEGVYEQQGEDKSYLKTSIAPIDMGPERLSRIAKAFYDQHPKLDRDNIERVEKAAQAFLSTYQYFLWEIPAFFVLGDMATLTASFNRELAYTPWLKAMDIIWKENPGPFLKTEPIEVDIFNPHARNVKKREEKKKQKQRKWLAKQQAQQACAAAPHNNQQNSPPNSPSKKERRRARRIAASQHNQDAPHSDSSLQTPIVTPSTSPDSSPRDARGTKHPSNIRIPSSAEEAKSPPGSPPPRDDSDSANSQSISPAPSPKSAADRSPNTSEDEAKHDRRRNPGRTKRRIDAAHSVLKAAFFQWENGDLDSEDEAKIHEIVTCAAKMMLPKSSVLAATQQGIFAHNAARPPRHSQPTADAAIIAGSSPPNGKIRLEG